MEFYDEFKSLIDALNRKGIEYAVCGGVAVAFHGYPRFTKDIDLLIKPGELAGVLEIVRELGFALSSGRIPFDVGGPKEREIYRVSKTEGEDLLTLDLIIAGPIYENIWEDRERFEWQGGELKIVSLEGLIEMKRIAGRAQDHLDVEKLLEANPRGEADDA